MERHRFASQHGLPRYHPMQIRRPVVKSPDLSSLGDYFIEFEAQPVGFDRAPMLRGKLSGAPSQDFNGFTLQLVNTKTRPDN
jgi:hypothetical protein